MVGDDRAAGDPVDAVGAVGAVGADDPRARWASWALVVAGCAYLLVLVPGARWFAGDDWFVLADQPTFNFLVEN